MSIKPKISKLLLAINLTELLAVVFLLISKPRPQDQIQDNAIYIITWYYILIYPITTIISWKLTDSKSTAIYRIMMLFWAFTIIMMFIM
ncbi:MAG: hypothetical protein GY754_29890 [bacterium]|nr:hypothetical protein [bacterium]